MAPACRVLFAFVFFLPVVLTADPPGSTGSTTRLSPAYGKLPLSFEENRGQADPEVKFLARSRGFELALTRDAGMVTRLKTRAAEPVEVRTTLVGALGAPAVCGVGRLQGRSNYILGNNPGGWLRDIPLFGRVEYRQVYPGIDLVYYGHEGQLEFDFRVAPGHDPDRIRIKFDLAGRLELSGDGDLVYRKDGSELRWHRPFVYQEVDGASRQVEGGFRITGQEVGFRISRYDRSVPLVIDPALVYSTYVGGSGNEAARGIAVDKDGAVYIAGETVSRNLPEASKGHQKTYGGPHNTIDFFTGDAFVTRLNAAGTQIVYSTYLGGGKTDMGLALAVDSSGSAYVTGFTNSTDFPTTPNAYRRSYLGGGPNNWVTGGDAFVTKLSPAGNSLIYSTYLGGDLDDRGTAITLDPGGYAYIAGTTMSPNFPTSPTAYQKRLAGSGGGAPFHGTASPIVTSGDAFVAKLDPTGSNVLFATYLGGSLDDSPSSIAIDSSSYIYLAGGTLSNNFPTTPGAYQTAFKGYGTTGQDLIRLGDGFVTKLTPDVSGLVYSTYFGGSRDDEVLALAVDKDGFAYIGGASTSSNLPVTQGVSQGTYKGGTAGTVNELVFGDAFIAKLNPTGNQLVFSTFLGGTMDDAVWGIAIDPSRNVLVAGHTQSRDFPVTNGALQKIFAGEEGDPVQLYGDAFVAKLDSSGARILYATYLGGKRDDVAAGLAIDSAGNGYIAGFSYSTDFPVTPGAAQRVFGGGGLGQGFFLGDAFAAKVSGLFDTQPGVVVSGIGNAASYVQGRVSPGELLVFFGDSIGPETIVTLKLNEQGFVASMLSDTQILFDGRPSPVIYASKRQSSGVAPYFLAGKTSTDVQIEYKGNRSAAVRLPVVESLPGLFSVDASGRGQGAILNQDLTLNSSSNPAGSESLVVLFGTGEGQTVPAGVDGQPANEVFPKFSLPVSVTIGGLPADVAYSGAAPFNVAGVFQINAKVPPGLPPGNHEVVVKIGTASSQSGLTVAVK